MPFHDLSVAYTTDHPSLSHTLEFHRELGYHVVALGVAVTGKLPSTPLAIPTAALSTTPGLQLLTRLTLTISDTTQNHRLASLHPQYDILALRPTTEKTLQLCCSSLECDLISLDFSQRLPFILKFKTVASALQRGIRFEICYSPGITGASDARRNLISGAASLIRATRGRGIIISSDARSALGVRAPWDVINLAQVWGLSQERGKEALCEEAGKVVKLAGIKRTSFRGVVDIINSGQTEEEKAKPQKMVQPRVSTLADNRTAQVTSSSPALKHVSTTTANGIKRKASTTLPAEVQSSGIQDDKPVSKREMKRRAKKARLESGLNPDAAIEDKTSPTNSDFPIQHEVKRPLETKKK